MSRRVWTCVVCGRAEVWGKTWQWYGSLKDLDGDSTHASKNVVCSDLCASRHVPVLLPTKGEIAAAGKVARKARRDAKRGLVPPSEPVEIRRGWAGTALS